MRPMMLDLRGKVNFAGVFMGATPLTVALSTGVTFATGEQANQRVELEAGRVTCRDQPNMEEVQEKILSYRDTNGRSDELGAKGGHLSLTQHSNSKGERLTFSSITGRNSLEGNRSRQ